MAPKTGKANGSADDGGRKLHRLVKTLLIIDSREQCTPDSLAERFGTDKRTVFRYIKDINSAGFAVEFDRKNDTYAFADPNFTLRDLDLGDDELTALLMGRQLAGKLGRPFEKAFQSLVKRARTCTDAATRGRIRKIEEKQQFWIDLAPADGFEMIEETYNILQKAMEERRETDIIYHGMGRQELTKRAIDPYCLFLHEGVWYVLAHCRTRRAIRQFALDRIRHIYLSRRAYEIPQGFSADRYFKAGWHIMHYGEPVEVVLKFSKDVARWITRRAWHPTQVTEEQPDGSLIFKVKLEGTEEIKRWTYHWSPHCEVIAPPELRTKVAEEVKTLAGVYA